MSPRVVQCETPCIIKEVVMFRIAILVWIVLGTTVAGSAITAVLVTPGLTAEAMKFIPIAGIAGYVVAIPFAVAIAKRIIGLTSGA
jgi:hypothetical protein